MQAAYLLLHYGARLEDKDAAGLAVLTEYFSAVHRVELWIWKAQKHRSLCVMSGTWRVR